MSDTSGLLSQFYLTINGADAPEEMMRDLLEVTVDTSLHLPAIATFVLHDPRLLWIDDPRLEPGVTLEVSAKSERTPQPLFDGEIVELEPDFGPGTQRLVVRAYDRLHRLSRGRHVRSFINTSDGDLVQKIASEVGLQASVGPTAQVHDYVLQNNETNFEFLRSRAAALGYLLYVKGKTLHFDAPTPNGQTVELEWGKNLNGFQPRYTTVDQVDSVVVRGWDPENRQELVGRADRGEGSPQVGNGKVGSEVAKQAFHLETQSQVAHIPVRSQSQADNLAKAEANRLAGRFVEAEGTCGGDPAILAGSTVTIGAVGERFNGTYFVTGATHTYSADQGYGTQFSVTGQQPSTLLSTLVAQHQAPKLSLAIGIVTDNQDPLGQGRVKVMFPWLSNEHNSNWARLVAPGAGKERGIEFLPEVNDEVLVGFELGDIHHPFVLGGLWNGQDPPPLPSNQIITGGEVQKRVIRSRTGHMITLDDTSGSGGITIEDSAGNKIEFETGPGKLTIKFQGDISIESQGNMKLDAQGQMQLKAMGITIDAGMATVDVKGSIINLN